MLRRISQGLLLLGLVLAAACARSSEEAAQEQAEETSGEARIVSIGGSITEILFALGQGHSVVGVDSSSLYPPAVAALPQIGSHHKVSVESILALRPSLVLANSTTPLAALEQVRSAGVRVVTIAEIATIEAIGSRIDEVAEAVGQADRGRALREKITKEIDDAMTEVPAQATFPRVLFVYARGARVVSVAGSGTGADALISAVGAVNAAGDSEGFRPISAEAVVAAKPDLLLMMTSGVSSLAGRDAAFDLPGVALTPAGEKRRLIEMDGLLMLGFGPRTPQAIRELRSSIATLLASDGGAH